MRRASSDSIETVLPDSSAFVYTAWKIYFESEPLLDCSRGAIVIFSINRGLLSEGFSETDELGAEDFLIAEQLVNEATMTK